MIDFASPAVGALNQGESAGILNALMESTGFEQIYSSEQSVAKATIQTSHESPPVEEVVEVTAPIEEPIVVPVLPVESVAPLVVEQPAVAQPSLALVVEEIAADPAQNELQATTPAPTQQT